MITVLTNLPAHIKGVSVCTAEPEGDFYTVVINSSLSSESQAEAYKHEKNHIDKDHFHDSRPLIVKEAEAKA